jgi:large subunit ribosomal protein L2
MVGSDFADITTSTPLKSLTTFLGKTGGRNSQGRTTSRFRGGGHKQLYRMIDFRGYDKLGVPATVSTIEYDPYRTCRIALLTYADGEKRYTLAWNGIQVGQKVMCGPDGELVEGNRKQLKDIPDGFLIHNLEVTPNTKGKMCRSAGAYAVLQGRDADEVYTIVKLQS